MELGPHDREDILEIFGDAANVRVLDNHNLNDILSSFPEVQRKHFKLWFSSVDILQSIIHSSELNLARIKSKQILGKVPKFVPNEGYFEAREILRENHVCLVSGEPGIGKSMISEILCAEYMADGYEFIFVTGHINQAYQLLQPGKKQVILYDDFLGDVALTGKLEKNEVEELRLIIEEARSGSGVVLILATREYVLNHATLEHAKLKKVLPELLKCVVEYGVYTIREKIDILQNHIFFSNQSVDVFDSILRPHVFRQVVTHRNFSPRLVEWIAEDFFDSGFPHETLLDRLEYLLENPYETWDHTFRNKINSECQLVLIDLAFLGKYADLNGLKSLYRNQKAAFNTLSVEREFNSAIATLNSSMISIYTGEAHSVACFLNPSIHDYVSAYLASTPDTLRLVIDTAYDPKILSNVYDICAQRTYQKNGGASLVIRYATLHNYLKQQSGYFLSCFKASIDSLADRTAQPSWYVRLLQVADDLDNMRDGMFIRSVFDNLMSLGDLGDCESFLTAIKLVKSKPALFQDVFISRIEYWDKFFSVIANVPSVDTARIYLKTFGSYSRLAEPTIAVLVEAFLRSELENGHPNIAKSDRRELLDILDLWRLEGGPDLTRLVPKGNKLKDEVDHRAKMGRLTDEDDDAYWEEEFTPEHGQHILRVIEKLRSPTLFST